MDSYEQLRFYLGDDGAKGVLPDGTNLSEAQLQTLIDQEGGDVMRAVALGFETLAARFAQVVSITVGQRREEYSQIAAAYTKLASEWRARYGAATPEGSAQGASGFAVGVSRQDGFSYLAGTTDAT